MIEKPEELYLADMLESDPSEDECVQAAACLRQQHAEIETMKIQQQAHDAFYNVTLQQRNSAWQEIELLKAENQRLRGIVPQALEELNDGLCKENEELHLELKLAYAEICKQVYGSRVVFDRDVVERARSLMQSNTN